MFLKTANSKIPLIQKALTESKQSHHQHFLKKNSNKTNHNYPSFHNHISWKTHTRSIKIIHHIQGSPIQNLKRDKLARENHTNLHEIAKGLSGSSGGGENIIDSSELQHLLGNPSRHDSRTPRSGNHPHGNRTALASNLAGNGVGLPDLVPPVPSPNGDNGKLRQNDGATNSGGHLLATLNAKTHVAVTVADHNEGLEPGSLTGPGLFLDRRDLHDLVLEGGTHEGVNDLVLLDGKGVEVDLLQASDSALFHQTSQLRHWDPLLLLFTARPSAAPATPVTAASTPAEATPETATVATSALCHCGLGERERESLEGREKEESASVCVRREDEVCVCFFVGFMWRERERIRVIGLVTGFVWTWTVDEFFLHPGTFLLHLRKKI